MRKRRVGVTAGSGQIAGNQATGSRQIESEIAAPLELRTPMSTAAKAASRVRMEAWRQWRWSQSGRRPIREEFAKEEEAGSPAAEERRADARMRRRLKLRQGASPLRPPAPFPSGFMFQNGGNLSRVRKPRRNGAPLTACHRSEDTAEMRERGPSARRAVSRVARGTARYARMRRCRILRQGASPLRPPHFPLDREWPSHGSPERQKLRKNRNVRKTGKTPR